MVFLFLLKLIEISRNVNFSSVEIDILTSTCEKSHYKNVLTNKYKRTDKVTTVHDNKTFPVAKNQIFFKKSVKLPANSTNFSERSSNFPTKIVIFFCKNRQIFNKKKNYYFKKSSDYGTDM